jgi:hypothetical protein
VVNSLSRELKSYKEENTRLKEENSYLVEMTKKLNDDNDRLENFKFTILNSIDGEPHIMKINKMQVANLIDSKSMHNNMNMNIKNSPNQENKKSVISSPKQNINKSLSNQALDKSFSPRSNYTYTSNIDELLGKLNTKVYTQNTHNTFHTNSSEEEINQQTKQNHSTRNGYATNHTNNFLSNKFDAKISEMKQKFKSNTNLNQVNNSYSSGVVRNYREINDQYKSAVFNDEYESNNGRKYEGKSNQYILSSKFFNECRIALRKEAYEELVSAINEKGDNNFDGDEVNQRVQDILKGHPRLIRDFQMIFPYLNK